MDAQPPYAEKAGSQAPIDAQGSEHSLFKQTPAQIEVSSDPGLPGTFPSTIGPQEHIQEDTLSLPQIEFAPGTHENLPAPADDSLSRAPFRDDARVPSVQIDGDGPYSSLADGDPISAPGPQEPAPSFAGPTTRSFSPFGSVQAPYSGFRGVGQGQATGEQSDSTQSSASIYRSSRNHQVSAIVVGVSGNTAPDRGTLVSLMRCLLPNIRGVVHQDNFRIAEPNGSSGTEGDVKEHVTTPDYHFDIRGFRRALKTLKSDPGPAVQLLDREQDPSSGFGLPNGVDEQELKTRLQSEIQGIQTAPVVVVEGPSLYTLKAIRKLIDVRICLLEDKDNRLPWAPMTGTLILSDYDIRSRRKRYEEDLLDTVVWRDRWYSDSVDGHGGKYTQGIVETIASWAIRLVADTLRDKKDEETRDRNDGRYQICDCGDGLIGKMRKWVFDHL